MRGKTLVLAFLCLLLLPGCGKSDPSSGGKPGNEQTTPSETDPEEPDDTPKPGDPVSIKVTLQEVETIAVKASVSADESGNLMPTWQDGETITVNGVEFTASSIDGATATFDGVIPEGESYNIAVGQPESGEALPVQAADGDASHIRYHAELKYADDFRDVVLSHGWAAEHGGTFSRSGALRLALNFPEGVKDVASVSFLTQGCPELKLNVTDGTLSEGSFVAYLPFEEGVLKLTGENKVKILVTDSEGTEFNLSFLPAAQTLYGGYVISLTTMPELWRKLFGTGELDPWEEFER